MRNKESLSGRLAREITESKKMKPADKHVIPERGELKGIGGWLLFFCVSLTILSPGTLVYQSMASLIKNGQVLTGNKIFHLANVALVVYGVVVGILLWSMRKNAVKQTKIFLLVSAIVFCILAILAIVFGMEQPIGIVVDFVEIIYLALWLLYFSNSRRVANTFQKERAEG